MSVITAILSILGKLAPALDATTRLVRAAKQSVRPKPPEPIGHSGAVAAREYLRGGNDEAFRQAERQRLIWASERLAEAAKAEVGESEKPEDEKL